MSKVNTPYFRVAFPSVFTPKRNELSGKDEYSLVALFPKGENLDKLKAAANEALVKKFGADKTKWPKKLRSPFRDQADRMKVNEETGKDELPQGYVAGCTYISLRSNQKPGLIDHDRQEILDTSEFYGGCWARASINAFAYDTKGNRGVSFGLGNLQKVKDGDAFGNRTKACDDFSAVELDSDSNATTENSAADLFG